MAATPRREGWLGWHRVVNPVGGARRGEQTYRQALEPALKAAGLVPELRLTRARGDARAIGHDTDLQQYAALLTVSGDGMLNEVVAGVWARPDRDDVLRALVVAVYPAGTGNGLATSLGWPPSPALAQGIATALQQATCTPLDVQDVVIGTDAPRPALLSTSWGFVAEHDTWSERKLRWMGRFWATALAPVLAALRGRTCRGRLAFLPAPGQPEVAERPAPQFVTKGPLPLARDGDWYVLEGRFVAVTVCNVAWLSADVCMAPRAKPADGSADLVIIHAGLSLAQLARTLLSLETAGHVALPWVDVVKVVEVAMSPTLPAAADEVFALDGELVPLAPLRLRVLPGRITTLQGPTPPPAPTP